MLFSEACVFLFSELEVCQILNRKRISNSSAGCFIGYNRPFPFDEISDYLPLLLDFQYCLEIYLLTTLAINKVLLLENFRLDV